MNLLLGEMPTKIIDVNGTLYFDTDALSDNDCDFEGVCLAYPIETGYRAIIDVMMMFEDESLTNAEKGYCLLPMFYIDSIPPDTEQAIKKAVEFLNCGKEEQKQSKAATKKYGRLWTWEQDGDYIFSAMNYSHNEILKREPNLHWWEFINKFMQLKDGCKFNDIVCNRLAHKNGKATAEQKTARQEFPEIYMLKADRAKGDAAAALAKELQDKLNS